MDDEFEHIYNRNYLTLAQYLNLNLTQDAMIP